jgi:hypothetical protein
MLSVGALPHHSALSGTACAVAMLPVDRSTSMNDLKPVSFDRDPLLATGEEMLERARQVSRSVDERIHKLIDQANRLVEHIDSYTPFLSRAV